MPDPSDPDSSASDSPASGGAAASHRRRDVASPTARARRLGGATRVSSPPAGARRGSTTATASAAAGLAEPTASSEPPKSRAGRNLPAAIGVGLLIAAVFVGSLFLYRPSFSYIVGLAVVYGTWELKKALDHAGVRVTLVPLWAGGVATLFAAWFSGAEGLVVAALVTVIGILAWRIGDGADGYLRDVSASTLLLLYLPTLAAFAVLLAYPDDGAGRILAFAATVVCSDTGGYATGVLFGRHPLAPVVSKGKTWEGFAGSVIACSACGILFMTLCFHAAWWKGWLFGLAIVATATVGDLGESMIKRDIGIKDMGSLLPGHGGVMDRLDSMLPCAAVAYLLLSTYVPA